MYFTAVIAQTFNDLLKMLERLYCYIVDQMPVDQMNTFSD